MAKIPNPLHIYRSTQYHFVLMCAKDDSTLTNIDKEEDVSDLSRYLHPEGGPMYKYDTKDISGNTYIVLYNSMKDVDFSIDTVSLEYNLIKNGSTHSFNATNEQGASLKMEIVEPYTADFVSILNVAASSLGVAKVSELRYGLKVIFVGYPDDHNTSNPHFICDVNLLTFQILDIQMSLTPRGCHYDVECIPLFNNAANHHSISKIGGMATTVPEALPDAVKKFESELNKVPQDAFPGYKPYKYNIVLDPAYNDPKYKLDVVADDQRNTFNGTQPLTKNNTASNKPANFVDQTQASTNAPTKQTTANTQASKSDSGELPTIQPNTRVLDFGEEKLRVLDQPNYQKYKDYRDNLFNQNLAKGQDADTALRRAKVAATSKFVNEIQNAINKSTNINVTKSTRSQNNDNPTF